MKKFQKLHSSEASPEFKAFLAKFTEKRERSERVLVDGIKIFGKIANLSLKQREDFYGSPYAGLHYATDLATLYTEDSSEKIDAVELSKVCPPCWDYQHEKLVFTLVYRGSKPSVALDKLLQGPTVIDCGIFCQLGIWFGIRYILGDDLFNQTFGQAPFYLTQALYGPIENTSMPYLGNPLYPFFIGESEYKELTANTVRISAVNNHEFYQLKHPGGDYLSDNCIVINEGYINFSSMLGAAHPVSREQIKKLLLDAFNATQDKHDHRRIVFYKTQSKDDFHPVFEKTYGELIENFNKLSNFRASKILPLETPQNTQTTLCFNFNKFLTWINMKDNIFIKVDDVPLPAKASHALCALVDNIPCENRHHVSFSTFKVNTPLQEKMLSISKKFFSNVMKSEPCCVILTGKSGVGKTASAVSCAQELKSRGKIVIWISEVIVRVWTNNVTSMKALSECKNKIKALLATNPDAVFLDDNNLVEYAGKILLEEIYTWYIQEKNKGLFITSNEPVEFTDCYGLALNGEYDYPPFSGYDSLQYINMYILSDLHGQNMRAKPVFDITQCSDSQKVAALHCYTGEDSVGIIIDEKTYQKEMASFNNIELIPAIRPLTLDILRVSYKKYRHLGPTYEAMSDLYKAWLIIIYKEKHDQKDKKDKDWSSPARKYQKSFEKLKVTHIATETLNDILQKHQKGFEKLGVTDTAKDKDWSSPAITDQKSFEKLKVTHIATETLNDIPCIYQKSFEKSNADYIAIELLDDITFDNKKIIEATCLERLLSVIHYAYNCGKKKIILINKTKFSHAELLNIIKESMPEREKERSFARIEVLLFSSQLVYSQGPYLEKSSAAKSPESVPFFLQPRYFLNQRLLHRDLMIAHRHLSPALQEAYDREFGLVLRN